MWMNHRDGPGGAMQFFRENSYLLVKTCTSYRLARTKRVNKRVSPPLLQVEEEEQQEEEEEKCGREKA